MIISASRRTDIPAFYADWFMNRIRSGYCTVPNPFNTKQVSRISLIPEQVDVIVFWTRNPRPLMPYLDELTSRGYRFYFQYTLMDNPRELDVRGPAYAAALQTFQQLSEQIGPERVVWRYDPVVISNRTDIDFHTATYQRIATDLKGYTRRSVISIVDDYRKIRRRIKALAASGIEVTYDLSPEALGQLMRAFKESADACGYEIFSCAEPLDLAQYGIQPGKCIDDDLIESIFGLSVTGRKDPSQREVCGCVASRDIGMYDTCLFGCQYCYATSSFERAKDNHSQHDPQSPSLIGHYDVPDERKPQGPRQLTLFSSDD